MDGVIGGVPSRVARATLPWMALSCAVTLTLGLVFANREHIRSKPHQLVTCALLCVLGAAMYIVYMMADRMLHLVLASIEYRSHHHVGLVPSPEGDEDDDEVSAAFLKALSGSPLGSSIAC